MKDGYWTPWHLTAQLQAENEALRMGAAQRQPIARYFHASGHVDPFPKSTEGKRYRLVEGTPGPTAGTEPCVHEFIPFTNGCSKCGEPYTYTTSSEAEDLLAATSLEFGERLEALEQERDILRKDAERYQWLRERDLETLHRGGVFAGQTPQNIVLNGETLDEAIDAAISKRVEQPRDCNCGACPAGCLSQVAP
ncbi:hypothetical protein M5C90_10660 [Pseudomonas chlororaphis subsp. piscium]|nr:hypothetical protein M5C90_10660 [Pseudomonas chlororaphis subsp. piscium]